MNEPKSAHGTVMQTTRRRQKGCNEIFASWLTMRELKRSEGQFNNFARRHNSGKKTHYGLVETRSGVRDYECRQDLNFGAGCAPSLAQVTESVLALAAEQVRDEQQPGQLIPSAIGPQTGRLFLTADSLPRSTPARRLHPYPHRAHERFCNNRSCRAWRTSLRWSAAACRKPRSR